MLRSMTGFGAAASESEPGTALRVEVRSVNHRHLALKLRLPEAFAGFHKNLTRYPVEYPTACSPQAWATGAPLLMLRVLLGMRPIEDNLLVAPAIPKTIERIELSCIPGRWGKADAFGRGVVDLAEA